MIKLYTSKSKLIHKKKVFIGTFNIASQINDWKSGFNSCGYETLTMIYGEHTKMIHTKGIDFNVDYYLHKKDLYRLKIIGKIKLFFLGKKYNDPVEYIYQKAIKECDIFVFIWDTFKKDFSDYEILKSLGKKIITVFVGNDIRWYNSMKQEFISFKLLPMEYGETVFFDSKHLSHRLLFLRNAERYSDVIISNPSQSQLALRPYLLFQLTLDFSLYINFPNQRKIPKIIHAPSNKNFKGTKYIINSINRLKDEGVEFEFELIHGLSNLEAIKKYEDCDILVGQLLCPWVGKQERELLACGKVVLSSFNYNYCDIDFYGDKKIIDECPIIDVNPDNIYLELKKIILDHDLRKDLAKKGRPYVEKYHSAKNEVSKILNYLENKDLLLENIDYLPSFFNKKFIPERENIDIYNKWNHYVSGCDWYEEHVSKGERDGLLF
jgi:hypothetical protein